MLLCVNVDSLEGVDCMSRCVFSNSIMITLSAAKFN